MAQVLAGVGTAVLLVVGSTVALLNADAVAAGTPPGKPQRLEVSIPQGRAAFELTWQSPKPTYPPPPTPTPSITETPTTTESPTETPTETASPSPEPEPVPVPVDGYQVLVNDEVVGQTAVTHFTVTAGLQLGRTYRLSVRALNDAGHGAEISRSQILYVNAVTTPQRANPDNPLAGRDWGVYMGDSDPYWSGWSRLSASDRDRLALPAVTSKAKFFGSWISDDSATKKTREYIRGAQAGHPERITFLTLFRMFPWEGEASIVKRLPTKAEQASYRAYVENTAEAIGSERVAVVVQPDGYFAKVAFDAHRREGRKKALLPARMLAWTVRTLARQPNTSVYMEMGSEDWARGNVKAVAKFLRLCGVKYARGFALNTSHKNYLDREVLFAKKVSQALAKRGIKDKHAVIDTSDNGHPFAGAELNPGGHNNPNYTAPGDINPCDKITAKGLCTALGVPPTTDVDNPRWGLSAAANRAAATYVDAYLWVSRPWLPHQGAGGTSLSVPFASKLVRTNPYSPYFAGTP